jgi:hypothetical protein
VVERLLAVQAQDLRAGMLSLRARTEALTIADVDRRLTAERSLVITWVMRGTLHLVRPDDLPWLLALTAPTQATACARRLEQNGVSADAADRGVQVIDRALADEGPLKREALRDRLVAAGLRAEGQALVYLLFQAAYRGILVRGPIEGRQHLFVRTADWLGSRPAVDRDKALAELARRYLAGFGPATDADLAYWAGLPLRDARAGLKAIAGELTEHEGGLVDLARREPPPETLPPRLLPLWDDLLVGWRDKSAIVAHEDAARVFAGGMIGPAATRAGRVVGKWSVAAGKVVVAPFNGSARGFGAEARDVERFLASQPGV